MSLVIGDTLRLAAEKYPEKIAVVFKEKGLTYRGLNSRANRLANGFLGLGLKKGDKVAILLHNCLEYPEIYYGLAKAGLVMVPVNFRFEAKEIEYVITGSDAQVLIVGQEFSEKIKAIQENLNETKEYIWVEGEIGGSKGYNYEDFLSKSSEEEPEAKVNEADIYFIGYTSGTTGFPKGALRTHRADMMNILVSALEFGFSEETVSLLVMPLFHCNSIWFCLATLAMGGKAVIHPSGSFNSADILEVIEKERVTFTSLVPTHYTFILNLPEEEKRKYDLSSISALLCSSAPLLTQTKEEILRFFSSARLFEAYGAAEAGLVTLLRPEDQLRKIRCIGQPVFGVEIKILDEEGRELAPGKIGELFIKSESLLKEYYKNPQDTQAGFREEYFSVGDMGKTDEEGYFYLVDRKNDMIISGGENVYPAEVEEIIIHHPKVKEVVVIGVPGGAWGDAVKAVVVLKEEEEACEREIIEFCCGKIAGYKRPKSVEFVDSLPKNPTGKILRRKVRDLYWQDKEIKI